MTSNWTRADAQAEINRAAKRPVETFKKFCAELKSAAEEIVRIGDETGFKDDATRGLKHLQGCMREIEKIFTPHTKPALKADEGETWASRGCTCGAKTLRIDQFRGGIIHGRHCDRFV